MTLVARGPSVELRLPDPADAEALFALAADPEVMRFFSWRWATPGDAAAWLEGRAAAREAGTWLELTVVADGRVAGITGLTEPSRRDRRAVTGSWLGRPFWGTGVNGEAKALLARIAFEACGLARLGAYASPENPRSRRALEKLGFRHEGTLRAFHRHGDRVHDVDVLALLRDEWAAGPMAQLPATVEGAPPAAFTALP